MPPHLHPRSRSTTSLFTATLFASFLIVGMPHLFPCPAPRRTLADSEVITMPDGQQRVRRRRRKRVEGLAETTDGAYPAQVDEVTAEFRHMDEEAKRLSKLGRECPVPKPQGILGHILGFGAPAGPPTQKSLDVSTKENDR